MKEVFQRVGSDQQKWFNFCWIFVDKEEELWEMTVGFDNIKIVGGLDRSCFRGISRE